MKHCPSYDEIDFGLGFRAALKWQLEELEREESFETFVARIKSEELR